VTATDEPTDDVGRFAAACAVADAVLHEGRHGDLGVLVPPESEQTHPAERSALHTECLVAPDAPGPFVLTVRLRCRHLRRRSLEALVGDPDDPDDPGATLDEQARLDRLDALDEPLIPFDEAVRQTVDLPVQVVVPGIAASRVELFRFGPTDEPEIVHSPQGEAVARLVRRRETVDGRVVLRVAPVAAGSAGLVKVTVAVENLTVWAPEDAACAPRKAMLRRSLVAVHTLLGVEGGRFLSLQAPPASAAEAARSCSNDGAFPVLVGPADDVVLAVPVALDDHPERRPVPVARLFPPPVPEPVPLSAPAAAVLATVPGAAGGAVPGGGARRPAVGPGWDGPALSALPVQAVADIPWWGSPVRRPTEGPVGPVAAGPTASPAGGDGAPAPGAAPVAGTGPGTGAAGGRRSRHRRVLVAGIGDDLRADDGFGVAVARRLADRPLPPGVRVADYGVRGVQLASELLDGYDALILLDAMALGEPAGTLAIVEPDDVPAVPLGRRSQVLDGPSLHPGVVLGLLDTFGVRVERLLIVGCQPLVLDGRGLSAPVAEAVDLAVELLADVLTDVCTPDDEAEPQPLGALGAHPG
jgi:hydrogenase maturation protease